jgi:two-component system chemotaxis sensor kinase CheA
VRDTARAGNKEVTLVIDGEATELDRSIIEAIRDPMVHLLRNAVDHGIERPEEREAAGKGPAGTLRVSAEHVEGQIVITVTDDGRGIDSGEIRQAAVTSGLITEEEATRLGDDEAVTLIFRPGLTTAEEVTDLSGRGVGLDVVRTNVGRIGGSVAVESEPGWGTTFRITLPLTLATVETMLVSLGDDTYAIPLTSIVESLYLEDVAISSIKGLPAIQWRERVLPLLDLSSFFGKETSESLPEELQDARRAIVVVTWGRLQAGLMVDRIIAKQEIVAKPLGSIIGNVPALSGCTILGDGSIALIVDVPSLINVTMQTRLRQGQNTQEVK